MPDFGHKILAKGCHGPTILSIPQLGLCQKSIRMSVRQWVWERKGGRAEGRGGKSLTPRSRSGGTQPVTEWRSYQVPLPFWTS